MDLGKTHTGHNLLPGPTDPSGVPSLSLGLAAEVMMTVQCLTGCCEHVCARSRNQGSSPLHILSWRCLAHTARGVQGLLPQVVFVNFLAQSP